MIMIIMIMDLGGSTVHKVLRGHSKWEGFLANFHWMPYCVPPFIRILSVSQIHWSVINGYESWLSSFFSLYSGVHLHFSAKKSSAMQLQKPIKHSNPLCQTPQSHFQSWSRNDDFWSCLLLSALGWPLRWSQAPCNIIRLGHHHILPNSQARSS